MDIIVKLVIYNQAIFSALWISQHDELLIKTNGLFGWMENSSFSLFGLMEKGDGWTLPLESTKNHPPKLGGKVERIIFHFKFIFLPNLFYHFLMLTV